LFDYTRSTIRIREVNQKCTNGIKIGTMSSLSKYDSQDLSAKLWIPH